MIRFRALSTRDTSELWCTCPTPLISENLSNPPTSRRGTHISLIIWPINSLHRYFTVTSMSYPCSKFRYLKAICVANLVAKRCRAEPPGTERLSGCAPPPDRLRASSAPSRDRVKESVKERESALARHNHGERGRCGERESPQKRCRGQPLGTERLQRCTPPTEPPQKYSKIGLALWRDTRQEDVEG